MEQKSRRYFLEFIPNTYTQKDDSTLLFSFLSWFKAKWQGTILLRLSMLEFKIERTKLNINQPHEKKSKNL